MFRPFPLGRCLAILVLSSLVAVLALLDALQAETPKGKKHALVVGVREYDSAKLTNLKYTENDAEGLAEVLREKGGFAVRLLTTSLGEKAKTDRPTVANLRAEIRNLLADKKRNDTVLIALSGHGIQAKVKDKEESFFCPADAQLNDNNKLLALGKLFADLDGCGAGIKLLLVDACRNDPKEGRNVDIETLPRLPRGTAALFSCSSGERAFETAKLGSGHGVFFFHVIAGLKGDAKNCAGEVTWLRLSEYVTERVSRAVPKLIGEGAQQTPELKVSLRGVSPVLVRLDNKEGVPPTTDRENPGKEEVVKGWGKEVTNSIGMKLVRIPKGTFTMGSPAEEAGRERCEEQHKVEITKEFWLGIYEVTQKQYQKVMGENPSYFSSDGFGKDKVAGMSTDDFPVEGVDHRNAMDFCKNLSALDAEKKSGRLYRLPTEAEWEYACRGGAPSHQTFHFGNPLSSKQANFNGNYPYGRAGKADFLRRPCKVGSYKPNAFGLYDMHGNVWEWCADGWDEDYYAESPPRDPQGPSVGSFNVIRGGGWSDRGQKCRSAYRNSYGIPGRWDLGFRVALVPAGP
jgi:formylglycine-generating enzyme required for sulfatase activity